MHFLYGICFYYGYFKKAHLFNHLSALQSLRIAYPEHSFTFLIALMIDEKDAEKRSAIGASVAKLFDGLENVVIECDYNWGGTIVGLYNAYKYLEVNDHKDWYVAFFEEDFVPLSPNFLTAALTKLENGNIYVGETTTGCIKQAHSRYNGRIKISRKFDSELEVWTDGGFYFSNYENLASIYETVGIFHKGDPTTRYNHGIDGIDYGEVGFPTLLHHHSFKFDCLHRTLYFKHN